MPDQHIADIIRVDGIDRKGFGIIAKLVMLDRELSIGAKAVYAYFCSYANGTAAFPRREKILSDLGIGIYAYYRCLRELTSNDYISIKRGASYPFPNTYTIISRPKKLAEKVTEHTEKQLLNGSEDQLIVKGIKSLGYGNIPKAVMIDPRLGYKAKALYAYFCSFAGAGSSAFPKRADIMHHLQISINPFQKYIHELIKYNYITVEQQKEKGRFSRNIYYLNEFPDEERGKEEMACRAALQKRKTAQAKKNQEQRKQGEVRPKCFKKLPKIETQKPVKAVVFGLSDRENQFSMPVEKVKKAVNLQPGEAMSQIEKLENEWESYAQIIKENIDYDVLIERYPGNKGLTDVIYNYILDSVMANTPIIRVNKQNVPQKIVKARFLKLNYENIEYVINQITRTETEIKNFRSYILSALYNSQTVDAYWQNQVNSDRRKRE